MKNSRIFFLATLILSLFLQTSFAGHSNYRSKSGKRKYSQGYTKAYPVYGSESSGLSLGIKGGVHMASVGLSTVVNTGTEVSSTVNASSMQGFITNFTGGMVANIGFNDKLSLQPELIYIQKGYKPISFFTSSSSASVTVNYMELPIMLRGAFGSEHFKFLILVGPTFGYALNGNATSSSQTETIKFDDKDGFKRFDFGVAGGAGFGIKIGESMLILEGRYQQSITPIADSESDGKVVSLGYNMTVGFMFPMGR